MRTDQTSSNQAIEAYIRRVASNEPVELLEAEMHRVVNVPAAVVNGRTLTKVTVQPISDNRSVENPIR